MVKQGKAGSGVLEVQDAAKMLFTTICAASQERPVSSLMIASSIPGEGDAMCAVELARAIAASGKTVTLVEADMRNRALAPLMDAKPNFGIRAVLAGQAPLSEAVAGTQVPNLHYLDCEPGVADPADVISSERFHGLVQQLGQAYDYVVYVAPPASEFVDAALLSTLVDATVLVVRPGKVKREQLASAYDRLSKAGANVLGICATDCEQGK